MCRRGWRTDTRQEDAVLSSSGRILKPAWRRDGLDLVHARVHVPGALWVARPELQLDVVAEPPRRVGRGQGPHAVAVDPQL
jgi:hypothetical protein